MKQQLSLMTSLFIVGLSSCGSTSTQVGDVAPLSGLNTAANVIVSPGQRLEGSDLKFNPEVKDLIIAKKIIALQKIRELQLITLNQVKAAKDAAASSESMWRDYLPWLEALEQLALNQKKNSDGGSNWSICEQKLSGQFLLRRHLQNICFREYLKYITQIKPVPTPEQYAALLSTQLFGSLQQDVVENQSMNYAQPVLSSEGGSSNSEKKVIFQLTTSQEELMAEKILDASLSSHLISSDRAALLTEFLIPRLKEATLLKSFFAVVFEKMTKTTSRHRELLKKISTSLQEGKNWSELEASLNSVDPVYRVLQQLQSKEGASAQLLESWTVARNSYFKANDDIVRMRREMFKTYQKGGTGELSEQDIKQAFELVHSVAMKKNNYYFYDECVKRMIVFSDFLTRNNRQEWARTLLKKVEKSWELSTEDRSEYNFNMLWSYLTVKDYKGAQRFLKQNELLAQFDHLDAKLQFWIAMVALYLEDHSDATEYFVKILQFNPITFYGVMAYMKVLELAPSKVVSYQQKYYTPKNKTFDFSNDRSTSQLNESNQSNHVNLTWILGSANPLPLSETFKSYYHRQSVWASIRATGMIQMEHQYQEKLLQEKYLAKDIDTETKRTHVTNYYHLLAVVLNHQGAHLPNFKISSQALNQKKVDIHYDFLKEMFPRPIAKYFSNHEQSYDLDVLFLYSLIRQESGFDERATSPVGALGLMQLMPQTAKRLDRSIASKQSLYDPTANIRLGTRYIANLLKKYDLNAVYALAAYNAGDHRVNQWMKGYFKYEDTLYNIESIPFEETRNYVKLIMRNLFFYRLVDNIERPQRSPSLTMDALMDVKDGKTELRRVQEAVKSKL